VLALVSPRGAALDAGSVGLAVARAWAGADRQVLFIDGDTEGSALADRLGTATRAGYSPVERGLPSLIAVRQPLTLKLLADHCFDLGTDPGSLWSLFAPFHPAGAAHAAGWLAERVPQLRDLGRERTVLVASSGLHADSPLLPLLRAARIVVFLAPAQTPEQVTSLGELREAAGLAQPGRQHGLLVVEGSSSIADGVMRTASGVPVAGRLPVLEDEGVLRLQGGRRERMFARAVGDLAEGLLSLLDTAADAARSPRPDLALVESAPASPAPTGGTGDGVAAAADAPEVPTWVAGGRGA